MHKHNQTLHVYGIRNCDTVRAALKWLESRGIEYEFHDFRKDGLAEEELRRWLNGPFAPKLVNRRSATWRKLDEAGRKRADRDPAGLLLENPTLIKRPVITNGTDVLCIGFASECREALS